MGQTLMVRGIGQDEGGDFDVLELGVGESRVSSFLSRAKRKVHLACIITCGTVQHVGANLARIRRCIDLWYFFIY
jgi:hypothetical protein